MNKKTIVSRTLPLILALLVVIVVAVCVTVFSGDKKTPMVENKNEAYFTVDLGYDKPIIISKEELYGKLKNGSNGLSYLVDILDKKLLSEKGYVQKVTDEEIFMDLYKVMTNKNSLESINHRHDVNLIAQEKNKQKRKMLLSKATDAKSLVLRTHSFDMDYISELNLESYDKQTIDKMYYYLFNNTGLTHPRHKEILERLRDKQPIEEIDEIFDYLNQLEADAAGYTDETKPKKGFLARLLKLK
jgi:hypothetical protein